MKNDYVIGDTVIVKQCASYDVVLNNCSYLNKGVVAGFSANKYYVDVFFTEYKDPLTGSISNNVTKSFTQRELYLYEFEEPIII